MSYDVEFFKNPDNIMSLKELEKNPPPHLPGVYGWYFRRIPPYLPTKGCQEKRSWPRKWKLLYIGSGERVNARILEMHFKGSADSSSLRLSLGCLLKIYLWRIPTNKEGEYRYVFGDKGEAKLSEWMAKYARVAWRESCEYGELEKEAIQRYRPPLNIAHNPVPFNPLSILRKAMKTYSQPVGFKPPRKLIRKAYKVFIRQAKDWPKR